MQISAYVTSVFSFEEIRELILHAKEAGRLEARCVSGREIAYRLILLGLDCGLQMPEIAGYLMRLEGFPMWPDVEELATLLRDLDR